MDEFKFYDEGEAVLISRWRDRKDLNPYLMSRNPKTGQFEKGTKHLKRYPLYNMDMIKETPHKPIVLIDKEHDCDLIVQTGKYVAITYPGNQRKWRLEYNHYLAYKHVVILALNPDPYMEAVWSEAQNRLMKGFPILDPNFNTQHKSKSVTYIRLAADSMLEWITKHGGSAELDKLIANTKPLEVAPDIPDLEALSAEEQSLQRLLNKGRPQDYTVAVQLAAEIPLMGLRHIYIGKIAASFLVPAKKVAQDVESFTPIRIIQEIPDPDIENVVETLCMLYPDDDRESHVYGPVQFVQQEIKRYKGITLSYPRVGSLLKQIGNRFGFKTIRNTQDPYRRMWLTLTSAQVDEMAETYGFERIINETSVKIREFEKGFCEILSNRSQPQSGTP
jgi:hypothetical protein